jgi:membrane-associated HD superfamily phosphohydrolase
MLSAAKPLSNKSRELEQAKAELEKILRQLREEEMERMLVLLEARLRKMLEAQNEVYDETIRLEESAGRVPVHELEIAAASLGRKEDQIVGEADRALVLMQEDGSSVAFPEALQQARTDMRTVANRLRRVKTDEVTQALEEDIIATLEETLAALQKALQELREQKASQQQQQQGSPGEQPLVDQLAELRMIRALQIRVNRRTEFYDGLIEGNHTAELELLEALRELAQRQERIFEATRDLHQGTNQ